MKLGNSLNRKVNMKYIFRIIVSSICCFFLVSCSHKETSPKEVIEIATFGAKPLLFEDLYESVDILLLEDNDKFPLLYVTKILCWEKFYYLLNDTGQGEQVIVYNLEGKFIMALSKKGKGPEEYSKIEDIDINPKSGELLVVDAIAKKLLVFNQGLNFEKSHTFEKIANPRLAAFCPWNSDEFIVASKTNVISSNQDYKIYIQDFTESTHKGYLPYENPQIGGSGGQFQLQKLNSTVSYLPRFSDYIYQISEDTCMQSYYLKFDRPTMPEGVRDVPFEYPDCIFNQKFFESENHLVIQFIYNELIYEAHFCKSQKTLKTAITLFKDSTRDGRVALFPIGFASERLVYFCNSTEIMNLIGSTDPNSRCISNPEILDRIKISEGTGILLFAKYRHCD